ncbi:O-antigen ligase family protein [Falsiroseomonas sp. HC035]|uniref:O-antigen ligase family protein n=1 Tax=Falsiroseomonas sp. HC035 TaxID=3390999 RepID=UPI003D319CC5
MSASIRTSADEGWKWSRRLLSVEAIASAVLICIILLSNGWDLASVISGSIDLSPETEEGTGSGDSLRQIAFLLLFGLAVGVRIIVAGPGSALSLPTMLIPLLAWCWLSVIWAIEPSIALRRIVFTTIVIVTIAHCVQMLSYRQVVSALMVGCGLILLADWAAIGSLQHAVHQPGRFADALIGDWRGIHNGKNEAGAFCALALILFLHEALRQKSWLTGGLLVAMSAVFLLQTHSKTAAAMVLAALAAGLFAQWSFSHGRGRRLVIPLGLGFGIAACIAFRDDLAQSFAWMMADPASLTGRVQIWPTLLEFSSDHPLLGAGYGSFWAIGPNSPIQDYGHGWIVGIYSAHNGYLDLLAQIGGIGLLLALACLIVWPLWLLLTVPLAAGASRGLICAMLTFGWLRDLLESSLLDRSSATWVMLVIMYCLLDRYAVRPQRSSDGTTHSVRSPA